MDEKAADVLTAPGKGPSSGTAQKSLADFRLRQGAYEEAASLYESTIRAVEEGGTTLSESDVLECKAGQVCALSYCDVKRAVELAAALDLRKEWGDRTEFDGEELEGMDIPRQSGGRSGRVRKMIGTRRGTDDTQKKNKKNQEAILRRRTKKRDLHLEKLRTKGLTNPDRPPKPDPERWIPKNQRSHARRGRKSRQKFVGAQGGGTGAGAERDALRLDAVARAAAKKEGRDVSSRPSTAHLMVSSHNGGKGERRR